MNETKRKLLGLFRTKSSAEERQSTSRKSGRDRERERERDRDDDRDRDRRERKSSQRKPSTSTTNTKSRPARSHSVGHLPPPSSRTPKPDPVRVSVGSRRPLLAWPPPKYTARDSMTPGKAMELVASGAPVFHGRKVAIEHATEGWDYLFAFTSLPEDAGELLVSAQSFKISSGGGDTKSEVQYPWETLEQPSMAFCHAPKSGTCMLNYWIAGQARISPEIGLKDIGAALTREVDLGTVLERLSILERGVKDQDEETLSKGLYRTLLKDPGKLTKSYKPMEKQIADLIVVLSSERWVDFSKPENQVVAKFFMNEGYTDQGKHKVFFHQLLIAMELDFRIQSPLHGVEAKKRLLMVLPERVKWDLVLARRWKEGVSIEGIKTADTSSESNQIKFNLKKKRNQIRRIRQFARVLKWPNLHAVEEILKNPDPDPSSPIERISSDAMSFFTCIILPGATTPFLTMNTLIDIDKNASPNLAMLTHMSPNCGFQYKSHSYWSSSCIVGKVLAPTCREIGGWIGPGPPVAELQPSKIARIRQRRPRKRLAALDVTSMAERSLPLGPAAKSYPVSDYSLLLPDLDPDSIVENLIRIEILILKPINQLTGSSEERSSKPSTYDAAVQFAVDGQSWPLRLSYDVSFILACPCRDGPHPLFFDYVFQIAKIDTILRIRDWGGFNARHSSGGVSPESRSANSLGSKSSDRNGGAQNGKAAAPENDDEKVLIIEAFGVVDNEVLARAWCAHWGLSAIVADVERSCMACAVREAYAACINVVILVEGIGKGSHDD